MEDHWWFGWWVRCKGSEHCPPGQHCILYWRRKGSNEHWADVGLIEDGSVEWSEYMEYQCRCGRRD